MIITRTTIEHKNNKKGKNKMISFKEFCIEAHRIKNAFEAGDTTPLNNLLDELLEREELPKTLPPFPKTPKTIDELYHSEEIKPGEIRYYQTAPMPEEDKGIPEPIYSKRLSKMLQFDRFKEPSRTAFIYATKDMSYSPFGDIHGDPLCLLLHLKNIHFFTDPLQHLILLGDYTDRGKENLLTIIILLLLQKYFPEKIHFNKGNHERYIQAMLKPEDIYEDPASRQEGLLYNKHIKPNDAIRLFQDDQTCKTGQKLAEFYARFLMTTTYWKWKKEEDSPQFPRTRSTSPTFFTGIKTSIKPGEDALFVHGTLPINYPRILREENPPLEAYFQNNDNGICGEFDKLARRVYLLSPRPSFEEGSFLEHRGYGHMCGESAVEAFQKIAEKLGSICCAHMHLQEEVITYEIFVRAFMGTFGKSPASGFPLKGQGDVLKTIRITMQEAGEYSISEIPGEISNAILKQPELIRSDSEESCEEDTTLGELFRTEPKNTKQECSLM